MFTSNYTVPRIGLEMIVLLCHRSHPRLDQKHTAAVPASLCNKPHEAAPQATSETAHISSGRGPSQRPDPIKLTELPAAWEQPLSSPHNYSLGPVKKPETLSLPHYSHREPKMLHRGSPGCTITKPQRCR